MPYQLVTMLISVATLLAVIISAYILNKQLNSDRVAKLQLHGLEVMKIFVNDPELYPYFYSKKDLPDSSSDAELYDKLFLVAEMLGDLHEHVFIQDEAVAQKGVSSGWKVYIEDMKTTSPVYRAYLEKNKPYYDRKKNTFGLRK